MAPRALALVLLLGACGSDPPAEPPPEPPDETLPDGNPIDLALEPIFAAEGIEPVEAGHRELCRRLGVDLLGVVFTRDEADGECAGRSLDDVVRDFQSRAGYRKVLHRHWRDRLETTDLFVNWNDVAELYELIDQAYDHRLEYGELVIAALAHPAFTLQFTSGEDRAAAAFTAFFGRPPTAFEAADIGNLFRTWFLGDEAADADFPYINRYFSHVPTGDCLQSARCSAILFGGATLDMTPFNGEMYRWDRVPDDLATVLRGPGELFVRQPMLWEAGASEMLERYLGWSDGGRAPRTVAATLPAVRQALADYLRISGDVADTERMVLTSWLYRQTAATGGELPVYASGPVKPMMPEVWLAAIGRHTRDLGSDEPRFPDHWYWFEMYTRYQDGALSLEQYNADIARLHQLQGNRMSLVTEVGGALVPSFELRDRARLLGGAPALGRVRQAPEGLAFAFYQDAIADELCADVEVTATSPGEIAGELMPRFYGRDATAADRQAFDDAFAACEPGPDCDTADLAADVCAALMTAPEMHFY